MRRLIFLFIFIFLTKNSLACFGPELFVGYERKNIESYIIASILDVYIKEKTGINVVLKEVDSEIIPRLLEKEQIDILAFSYGSDKTKGLNLTKDKKITLFYRKKIEEDLRFNSLLEAITNLSKGLSKKDLDDLNVLVEKKGKIKRTIKEYLMEKGLW
ncbi:MAG: hypothetical protein N2999_03195 [Proteobacteria bacterium]|nr:hypothetical protein [Pseudomonadota bacterium]